ncbi:MAG: hypothetical protein ACKORI_10645 [Verrucomicrobiota bacterium]
MLPFIRLLAAFLVGGVAGAAAVLLLQPTFSIVVTNAPAGVTTLVDAHPPVVDEPEFVPPPAPVSASVAGGRPATPAPGVSVPPPVTPAPDAPIEYAQVAGRPAFWPAEVQAVVPSVITFSEDGKKTEEMRIASGTTLQLSGVQPDGTLELRAQGRKFTLHAKFTDFDGLVRKKARELIARASGATPAAPAPSATAAVAPEPVVAAVAPAPAKPRGPLTMQQKLDALYGRNKEEPVAPPSPPPAAPSVPSAAPSAPVSPSAPATPAAPAPASSASSESADQSAKDADLKRRMDGLFKPAAAPAR